MELSITKTNTIIIKAFTNSEWDSVDFVLVRISDSYLKTIAERYRSVEILNKDNYFYNVSYWDAPDGWFLTDNSLVLDLEDRDWSYIDISDDEIEQLSSPEQTIDAQQCKISSDTLSFQGYGKHTSEEFWTASVPISEIIKEVE